MVQRSLMVKTAKIVPRNFGTFVDGERLTREISRHLYREMPSVGLHSRMTFGRRALMMKTWHLALKCSENVPVGRLVVFPRIRGQPERERGWPDTRSEARFGKGRLDHLEPPRGVQQHTHLIRPGWVRSHPSPLIEPLFGRKVAKLRHSGVWLRVDGPY